MGESRDHPHELDDAEIPDPTLLEAFNEAIENLGIDKPLESNGTTDNASRDRESGTPLKQLTGSGWAASKNNANALLAFAPTLQTEEEKANEEESSSFGPNQESSKELQSERRAPWVVTGFASRADLAHWFPQIDHDESKSWRIWLSKRSRALLLHTGIVGVILLTNFILTLWAAANYPHSRGVSTLYQGSCAFVKRLDLWLHLLINVLSTGMLMASNYCMQLQAAPTRKNVDKAHKVQDWLDIGVPSLRNLRYISNWRRFSWVLLALSSLPVHLMYVDCPLCSGDSFR